MKNGALFLRLSTGLLFLIVGGKKLLNPDGIYGMLGGLGFPAVGFFTWLLIVVEILGGLMLLMNFKVKIATYPLMAILVISIILVKFKVGIAASLVDLVIFSALLALNLEG